LENRENGRRGLIVIGGIHDIAFSAKKKTSENHFQNTAISEWRLGNRGKKRLMVIS
jgi:hypothetical protein